jgi:ligand-binding SRPBCC domain-containing protein
MLKKNNSMTKLHHEIKINVPVEKAWKILADLETVQLYNPLVTHTEYMAGSREGVGAARHCDFKPNGFSKERVTAWEPKKSISFEVIESSWPMSMCRWKTDLIPDGDGTLVLQDIEYEVKFGVLGKLMDIVVMRRKFNAILKDIFRGLKQFAEKN